MLLLLVGLAAPDVAPLADGVGSHDPPTRTAKERLGAKASDEQQVDNLASASTSVPALRLTGGPGLGHAASATSRHDRDNSYQREAGMGIVVQKIARVQP